MELARLDDDASTAARGGVENADDADDADADAEQVSRARTTRRTANASHRVVSPSHRTAPQRIAAHWIALAHNGHTLKTVQATLRAHNAPEVGS